VNASLITGLSSPEEILILGSNIFVTNFVSGTVGEYTTSGATVNATLISGLSGPDGIVLVPSATPQPGSFGLVAVALAGWDSRGGDGPLRVLSVDCFPDRRGRQGGITLDPLAIARGYYEHQTKRVQAPRRVTLVVERFGQSVPKNRAGCV
jgi:hypothetical protein